MIRHLKEIVIITALTVVSFGFFGCGSGASNDQGVSFTLLGFFDGLAGNPEQVTVVPLSFNSEGENGETQGNQFEDGFTDNVNTSGSIFSFARSLNNLSQQFIRTDAMYLSYFIPGASRQPPSTATAYSQVLGPATGTIEEGEEPFDSTLPPSFADEDNAPSNVGTALVSVVTPDVMAWLNLNRTSLPELPFDMIVTAYASGVTSAGDRLDSNQVQYLVRYTPDNVIPPDSGAPEGGDNADPVDDAAAAP